MGHKDDLFGGFFDFNGDGKTSFDEEFISMMILDDIDKSMREENGDFYSPTVRSESAYRAFPKTSSQKPESKKPYTKSEFLTDLWSLIGAGVFIIGALILISCAVLKDGGDGSGGVAILNAVIGTVIAVTVLSLISDNYNIYRKDNPPPKLSREEQNNPAPTKRIDPHEENMLALKIVVIVLVIAVLFPLVTFGISTAISQSKYNSAERLFYLGRYEEARHAFFDLSGFKDAEAYEFMCFALMDYNRGDIANAYNCMCRTKFYYLDAEEAAKITAQMKIISDEYKQYVEKIKADEEKAKYYDGRLRNKYDVPMTYNYFTPVTTTTSYVYKPSKPSKPDDDPYNAKDFRNAEDFYDFHYYDFIDYYDAENYYREHCD